MSREQQIIKQELGRLRQTSTTTWGVLPPRPGEEATPQPGSPDHRWGRQGTKRKKKSLEEKKLAEQRKQAEAVRKFREEVGRGGWTGDEKTADATEDTDANNTNTKGSAGATKTEPATTTTSTENGKVGHAASAETPASASALPRLPALPESCTSPQDDDGASSRATNRTTSVSDIALVDLNVHEAKDSVARRLVSNPAERSEHPAMTSPLRPPPALSPVRESAEAEEEVPQSSQQNPQSSTQKKGQSQSQKKSQGKMVTPKPKAKAGEQVFDGLRYNPDGSLRTVHTLPDFQSSLREAMKARYLRMKGAQWIERELSTSEIFGKRSKKGSAKSGESKK
jgi:hypothetical protein